MTKTTSILLRGCAFAIVATFTIGLFHSATAQDGPALTTEESVELLTGNTLKGTGYSIYFLADGTLRGKEGSYTDEGEWGIVDGVPCIRWKNWVQGKEVCHELRRDGNTIYRKGLNKNSVDVREQWYEGNVDGL
jgi:hypothetical protein